MNGLWDYNSTTIMLLVSKEKLKPSNLQEIDGMSLFPAIDFPSILDFPLFRKYYSYKNTRKFLAQITTESFML